jgi:hypothetical protein
MEEKRDSVRESPLCREAARCLTTCPKCKRAMQARWLRYAHSCRGDLEAREQEAVDRAHEAFQQREASRKMESAADSRRENAAAKYGQLFSGLRRA